MNVIPKIEMGVAHRLEHGTPVVLRDGGFGLIWQFASTGHYRISSHKRVLDLQSMTARLVDECAVQGTYLPVIEGSLELRPCLATAKAADVQAGDLFISGVSEAIGRIFIALRDPNEETLFGFCLDDPDVAAPIHNGYVTIFPKWRLSLCIGDDERLDLVDR